jgi:hypothetical protein
MKHREDRRVKKKRKRNQAKLKESEQRRSRACFSIEPVNVGATKKEDKVIHNLG